MFKNDKIRTLESGEKLWEREAAELFSASLNPRVSGADRDTGEHSDALILALGPLQIVVHVENLVTFALFQSPREALEVSAGGRAYFRDLVGRRRLLVLVRPDSEGRQRVIVNRLHQVESMRFKQSGELGKFDQMTNDQASPDEGELVAVQREARKFNEPALNWPIRG